MPVIALCSWAAVTQNLDATSARGVVSSNKCFSSVQYTAAARTLVGVRASQLLNAECDGSGRMLFLQNWISSFRSDGIVDVLGTGGGARRGETWPIRKWRFREFNVKLRDSCNSRKQGVGSCLTSV